MPCVFMDDGLGELSWSVNYYLSSQKIVNTCLTHVDMLYAKGGMLYFNINRNSSYI